MTLLCGLYKTVPKTIIFSNKVLIVVIFTTYFELPTPKTTIVSGLQTYGIEQLCSACCSFPILCSKL